MPKRYPKTIEAYKAHNRQQPESRQHSVLLEVDINDTPA